MGRTTIASLMAHKLRLLLTALAVVLGIGFLSGTLMLTDTMQRAFTDLFATTSQGIDVQVRGASSFGNDPTQSAVTSQRTAVEAGVLDDILAVDGVAAADPSITGYAQVLDADGEPVGGMGGPPTIGTNAPADLDRAFITLRAGRLPTADDEVMLDAGTAASAEIGVGDAVTVLTTGAPVEAEVVGVFGYGEGGEQDSLAGATVVTWTLERAQALYRPDGTFDTIDVTAAEGVSQEALAERVDAVIGAGYEVVTGADISEENAAGLADSLGFFNTAMLVFAFIALFVGAFLILNTFTIIVAQRTREYALLRAVGASRRQVLGSVIGEAGAVGLVGSLLGVVLGLGIAKGLIAVLGGFGLDLPDAPLAFSSRILLISLAVGIVLTVLAAIAPARRATRVPPVAALQSVAAPPPPAAGRARNIVGGVLVAAGLAMLAFGLGLVGDVVVPLVGAGAFATMIGAAVLSPLATGPLVKVLGWPIARLRGTPGQLAQSNALRNPRRTASTAAALMIGLGLVGFITIFAASIKASVSAGIDEVFLSDFTLTTGGMNGFSEDAVDTVAALPEVEVATGQRFGGFRYDGKDLFLLSIDPQTFDQVLAIEARQGAIADLDAGGVAVSADVAEAEGWSVGDAIPLQFGLTGEQTLPLAAVFDGANIDVDWVVSHDTFAEHIREPLMVQGYVKLAEGVDAEAGREAVEDALAAYPTVSVLDADGFKAQAEAQVNQLLGLIFALLFMSVLIALFGIVNTLGLSVYERVRELGMLRAVGMSRAQVRSMMRWESVLIAVLGALFGLGIGVVFGWMMVEAMSGMGITAFVVPYGQLAGAVLAAAVAGVLAAVLPARRAARVDILRAVTVD